MYPEPLFSIAVETNVPQSEPSPMSRSIDKTLIATKTFSIGFDFLCLEDFRGFGWRRLDGLLIGLQSLSSLHITLRCSRNMQRKSSPAYEEVDQLIEEMKTHLLGLLENPQDQDFRDIGRKAYDEQWSQLRKDGLKLVQEQMPLMKPVLSLDFLWL